MPLSNIDGEGSENSGEGAFRRRRRANGALCRAAISIAATLPLPDYTNLDISQEPVYGSVPAGRVVHVEASDIPSPP
jgi:hypothetical protein